MGYISMLPELSCCKCNTNFITNNRLFYNNKIDFSWFEWECGECGQKQKSQIEIEIGILDTVPIEEKPKKKWWRLF